MNNIYQKLDLMDGSRHTALSKEEGEFLYSFLKKKKLKKTLETGMAFGVSTAYIMSATNSVHYVIDPFQESEKYKNKGKKNIEKLGLNKNLKLLSVNSSIALPKLYEKKMKFEFVFMDGSHKFDDQFVDFYFIDLLLKKNGYVVMHDAWTPQVKTLLSWIETNKANYKKIKSKSEDFVILKKIDADTRKWFEFEKFEVIKKGNVSRYM